jgi:hypothetical protein
MVSGHVAVLSPRPGVSSGCGWSRRPSYITVAVNMYNESEIADKECRLILGIKRCLIITHRQDLACCEISGRGKSQFEGSDEPLGSGRGNGISYYQSNDFLLKTDCTSGVLLGDSVWWSAGVVLGWITKRQFKTTSSMRSANFWNFSQRRIVIPHRRFGTTCRCYLQGRAVHKEFLLVCLTLMMGITGCPETSVRMWIVNQLHALIFSNIFICLSHSTCFGHYVPIIRRDPIAPTQLLYLSFHFSCVSCEHYRWTHIVLTRYTAKTEWQVQKLC